MRIISVSDRIDFIVYYFIKNFGKVLIYKRYLKWTSWMNWHVRAQFIKTVKLKGVTLSASKIDHTLR